MHIKIIILALISINSISCKTIQNNSKTNSLSETTSKSNKIASLKNNTLFSYRLYEAIINNSGNNKNTVISPASIKAAITLAYLGASGETKSNILKSLNSAYKKNTKYTLIREFKDLLNTTTSNRYKLAVANKIFVAPNIQFSGEFTTSVNQLLYSTSKNNNTSASRHRFKSKFTDNFETLSKQVPKSMWKETINSYVNNKTAGKISTIMQEDPNANFVAALINAIYFQADWKYAFDPSNTKLETFENLQGDWEDDAIYMMNWNKNHQQFKENLDILENRDYTVIDLPFNNSDLVMTLVSTNDVSEFHNLKQKIQDILQNFTVNKQSKLAFIELPVFTIASGSSIVNSLKNIVPALTNPNATFNDFTSNSNNFYVSDIIHKAQIEVNECGASAAAATLIEIQSRSIRWRPCNCFRGNKPFIYIIRKKTSIEPLFIGQYVKASKPQKGDKVIAKCNKNKAPTFKQFK